MTGRIVLLTIGGLVAAALLVIMASLGFPILFALSWMLIAAAVVLASRQPFVDEGAAWPPMKPAREARGSEVSRLAWAINPRTGVAGHVVVRRVQSVLRRRLAHQGLDLDDPAQHEDIDALLGEGVREGLHRREVHTADIERALDALDRIPSELKENR